MQFRIRKYYVPPPFITSYYEYQDLNKDKKMVMTISNYITEKVLVELSKMKKDKLARKIDNEEGFNLMYKLMDKYITEKKFKWTDWKNYYYPIKGYLISYLVKKFN